MSKYGLFIRIALFVATMLVLANPLMADVTGSVLGTVTDPSGAVVPGATVSYPTTLSRLSTTSPKLWGAIP